MGVGGQGYAPVAIPPGDRQPISQEVCWVPGSFWKGAKNLFPTEIRSSDGSNFVAVVFLNYKVWETGI